MLIIRAWYNIIMSELNRETPRVLSESEIAQIIGDAHQEFLDKVPNYASGVWHPAEALRQYTGSCMAELLYVTGHLLNEGVKVDDISVGFADHHGQDQSQGFVGKSGKKYAHTSLYVGALDHRGLASTMMADFRAFSEHHIAVEKMPSDEYANERVLEGYTIYPLEDAIKKYALEAPQDGLPTIDDLKAIANGTYSPYDARDTSQIRFDEDF